MMVLLFGHKLKHIQVEDICFYLYLYGIQAVLYKSALTN